MPGTENREVAIYLRMVNQLGGGIRSAERALGGFRRRVNRDFLRLGAAVTFALAGALTASVAAGADFEQAMANVGSVARATESEMAALEEQALSLGRSTAFSASEAAGAMYSLASGGLDAAQIVASSEPVLKLAGATLSDMGSSAELTMSAMRQFGLQADDTRKIVNVFAAGIQNSMLNMDRLRLSLSYVGPLADTMNIGLEETVGTLAALHNAGVLGEKAGTGLAAALRRLADPGKELRAVLGDLTVEGDGLPAVAQALQDAGLSAAEMARMFEAESIPAVAALANAGGAELQRLTDAVTDTQAAWEMYDQQMNTTRGIMATLKSVVQDTLIGTFEQIRPVLNDVMIRIREFVSSSRPAIMGFVTDAAVAMQGLYHEITGAISWLQQNWGVIKDVAVAVGTATGVVYGLATAVGVLNAVMSANPIGIIVTAIGALTAGIVYLVRQMGGWEVAWLQVKRVASLSLEAIKYWWRDFVQDLRNFSNTADALKKTFSILWTALKDGFEAFRSRFSESWDTLWSVIRDPRKIGDLSDVKDIWKGFGDDLSAALGDGISSQIQAAWEEAGRISNAASEDVYAEFVANANAIERRFQEQIAAARAEGAKAGTGRRYEYSADYFQIPEQAAAPEPEAYGPYIEEVRTAQQATKDAGQEGERSFRAVEDAARQAASAVGGLMVDSIFEARDALEALGSVGRSVFGTLVTGAIRFGLGSIGPAGGFFSTVFGGNSALGGVMLPGRIYEVGEQGRERIYSHGSGRIVPEGQSSGPQVIENHYHVSASVVTEAGSLLLADDDMAVDRLASALGGRIEERMRRTRRSS